VVRARDDRQHGPHRDRGGLRDAAVIGSSLVAGRVVDRLGAKRTRVASDAVSAGAVLAIPVLHAGVGIAYWQILVLVAVNGALRTPAVAASLVLLRTATEARRHRPGACDGGVHGERADRGVGGRTARGRADRGLRRVLDPRAGRGDVRALGAHRRLWLRAEERAGGPRATASPAGVLRGVAVLARDRVLSALCVLVVAVAVIEAAWGSVVAPVFGQRVLDSSLALGALFGAFGVGALAGNAAFPWLAARWEPHRLLCAGLVLMGPVRYGALATTTSVPVLLAASVVGGAGVGVLAPLWLRLQYDRVAPAEQGHVFGVTFGLEQAGVALGALLGGVALSQVSPQTALAAAAVLGGLAAAGASAVRSW
jgi:predicted MFS family arabinose efflux permease